MNQTESSDPIKPDLHEETAQVSKNLRWWPLGLISLLQVVLVVIWLTPSINNFIRFAIMFAGPMGCGFLYVVFLVFGSRLGILRGMVVAGSMAAMGILVGVTAAPRSEIGAWILGIPLALCLCTAGLVLSGSLSRGKQAGLAIVMMGLGWGFLSLLRIDGIDGSYLPEMVWRWTPSAEQRFLESLDEEGAVTDKQRNWKPNDLGWPGFRGPQRDSRYVGVLPVQDWEQKPPRERWRRTVGPGWSSMAVTSGRLFTQEQHGENEAITCYDSDSGELIWVHREPARFEEVVSGAGPRGTPTVIGERVFAYGAKGSLVALDSATGELIWRCDLTEEYDAQMPVWGFSSSPLVSGGLVVVYAGGAEGRGLLAFDEATGELVWSIASTGMNFGSAQIMTLHGESQLVYSEPGLIRGLELQTGNEFWRADVIEPNEFPMTQPQLLENNQIVVTSGDGKATVCIEVLKDEEWSVKQLWKSRHLRPSFNDFVYFDGALFGFDKQIFSSIAADSGNKNWRKGRFGFGQVVLLQSTGQLVVVAESGELVLVKADPERFQMQGTVQAMSSKTWNHPAIHNGRLFVRNAEEMVCYELTESP